MHTIAATNTTLGIHSALVFAPVLGIIGLILLYSANNPLCHTFCNKIQKKAQ